MQSILYSIRSKNLVPILIIYFAVGITGIIIPATRELFKALTPFTLLLSIFLLYLFHTPYSTRFWLISVVILVAGFLVEVVGVRTGLLFGAYQYGGTLGIKLFHTPLMIGVNWLLLVYCSLYIAGRYVEPIYFRAIVAAALMVVYDFALEPAAIYLDMWSWDGGAVPLQNYLAWGIIGFGLTYLAGKFRLTATENKLATPLFFIQLIFFVILDIWIYASGVWV
jgi:putative membrane protein